MNSKVYLSVNRPQNCATSSEFKNRNHLVKVNNKTRNTPTCVELNRHQQAEPGLQENLERKQQPSVNKGHLHATSSVKEKK